MSGMGLNGQVGDFNFNNINNYMFSLILIINPPILLVLVAYSSAGMYYKCISKRDNYCIRDKMRHKL